MQFLGPFSVYRFCTDMMSIKSFLIQNTLGENESAYAGQGPCLVLLELPPRKTENKIGPDNTVTVSTSF